MFHYILDNTLTWREMAHQQFEWFAVGPMDPPACQIDMKVMHQDRLYGPKQGHPGNHLILSKLHHQLKLMPENLKARQSNVTTEKKNISCVPPNHHNLFPFTFQNVNT